MKNVNDYARLAETTLATGVDESSTTAELVAVAAVAQVYATLAFAAAVNGL